jgi:hypothetical protein
MKSLVKDQVRTARDATEKEVDKPLVRGVDGLLASVRRGRQSP